jgi:hypothetical protein
VESFHDRNAISLSDGSKSRQDVLGFAPHVLKVLALELGALIDNQVFGPNYLSHHDSIQCGGHVFGRRSALEHGASYGPPGEMIDHVQQPPADGPSLTDCDGDPIGPKTA